MNVILTGKTPLESGITTMFPSPESYDQSSGSLPSLLRSAGYCSVAVGEYPADFFNRINYGFDHVSAPKNHFNEVVLQVIMRRDFLLQAIMAWDFLRSLMPQTARFIFEGQDRFSSVGGSLKKLQQGAEFCGKRPIFAVLFLGQLHHPYVQAFPEHLSLKRSYAGLFQFEKELFSFPQNEEDRWRTAELYSSALKRVDRDLVRLFSDLQLSHFFNYSTLILSSDHGEGLYQNANYQAHGDQIGSVESLSVPLILAGRGVERLKFSKMESAFLLNFIILKLAGHSKGSLKEKQAEVMETETDIWTIENQDVPANRIDYPSMKETLYLEGHGWLALKDKYRDVVECAKHRMFLKGDQRCDYRPNSIGVQLTCEGIGRKSLPKWFLEIVKKKQIELREFDCF
jgi:hypothetical protein